MSSRIDPLYMVAVQLKTLIAEGIATRKLKNREDHARVHRLARDEHVVAPDQETQDRDGDAGKRDEADSRRSAAARSKERSQLTTPMPGRTMM